MTIVASSPSALSLPALPPLTEPFRGIEPYRFVDQPIFFERREEARRLAKMAVVYRGVMLFGDSGVGKSSLINAGLLPEILGEALLPERIRVQPVRGREFVVERVSLNEAGEPPFLPSRFAGDHELRARIEVPAEGLTSIITHAHPGGPGLLILDQFEELVTLFEEAPDTRERLLAAIETQGTIIKTITGLLLDGELPVKCLFVFREDYLAKLSKVFQSVPGLRDQAMRLEPLPIERLPDIICGPFESDRLPRGYFKREFSPEVANALASALSERNEGGNVNLTEVQIVCQTLWREPGGAERFVGATDRSQAIQELLERYTDGRIQSLPKELRDPAVAVLSRLVTSAGTRNIVAESELIERLDKEEGVPRNLAERALAALVSETKLVRRQIRHDAPFCDIASEFLVPWIQRQRVTREAIKTEAASHAKARERWRNRILIGTLVSALLMLIMFTVAMRQWTLAEYSAKQAMRSKADAEKAEAAAEQALEVERTLKRRLEQQLLAARESQKLASDANVAQQKLSNSSEHATELLRNLASEVKSRLTPEQNHRFEEGIAALGQVSTFAQSSVDAAQRVVDTTQALTQEIKESLAKTSADPYQKVDSELVRKVDLAKQKQVDRTDLKQAESLLIDVLKRKPDYYSALHNLGQLYDTEGNYDKAIKTLKKAEEVRYGENIPDNSILASLGWVYLNAGNVDKAEDYLKKAYATRDENTASTNNRMLYNLGLLYFKKNQWEEARKYLTEAIDKYQSVDARTILKLVNDYEQRQNKGELSEERWAVYGEQVKATGQWSEQHFNVQSGNKAPVPKPKDIVIAKDQVTVRSRVPVWNNEIQDVIVGPPVDYIKRGDRVRVLEVLDVNPDPNDPNAYYFIRLERLPKE